MDRLLSDLANSSVALIRSHQHRSGAFPACPTYPVYGYCWFRDGSFIADAMSRVGEVDSAEAFFDWCARVLRDRAADVLDMRQRVRQGLPTDESRLLPTRYDLDGRPDAAPWANFQTDGYGTWLRALLDHGQRHGRSLERYRDAVEVTVDYLMAVGIRPCYDWWEEQPDKRHTSTLGAVQSGLRAAIESGLLTAERAEGATRTVDEIAELVAQDTRRAGHLTKWLGSETVDGSLLACLVPFGVVPLDGPVAARTVELIRRDLLQHGVYRYVGDSFYGGGEWLILAAWLGWYEARLGDLDAARGRLDWIVGQATVDLLLPEQVSSKVQEPGRLAEWQDRWGNVATPLLWSHAMFLTLASECGLGLVSSPAQDHCLVFRDPVSAI